MTVYRYIILGGKSGPLLNLSYFNVIYILYYNFIYFHILSNMKFLMSMKQVFAFSKYVHTKDNTNGKSFNYIELKNKFFALDM